MLLERAKLTSGTTWHTAGQLYKQRNCCYHIIKKAMQNIFIGVIIVKMAKLVERISKTPGKLLKKIIPVKKKRDRIPA